MDLNIIIMSAIIIAICILPFVILSRNSKRKKKRIKSILSDIAKTKSGEIGAYEICGNLAVGITQEDEAFVFYNKKEDDTELKSCILLDQFKKCNFIKTSSSSGSGSIGKLILEFEHLDKNQSDVSLEFFNSSENFQMGGELELVEKWKPIIDEAINNQKEARQSAQSKNNSIKTVTV